LTDAGLKVRTLRLPDLFQEHENPAKQYAEARLDAPAIVETVLEALRFNSVGIAEVSRA
jgi:1-deoxy-D-xylulose-5-phosphate synthase